MVKLKHYRKLNKPAVAAASAAIAALSCARRFDNLCCNVAGSCCDVLVCNGFR